MSVASAAEHHGQVTFNGLPLPGATITATHGDKKFVTISNEDGSYAFADLPDGTWHISIEMQCFAKLDQDVSIASNSPGIKWELKMLPLDQILAQTRVQKATAPVIGAVATPGPVAPKPGEAAAPEPPKSQEDSSQQPSDGFLVNGSVNNASTSQFTISPAFGNTRSGTKGLYTGSVGLIINNSAFDAQPYSFTGTNLPKASYTELTGVATFGGPIKIPHLLPRGPNFFIAYQWTRDANASILPGTVPTVEQRSGAFTSTIYNPATAQPYPGNVVFPISSQAQTLLNLYPMPNITGNPSYNYEIPILSHTHQDSMQSRLDKSIGQRNQFYGGFAFQSTRTNGANLFGFIDTTDILGLTSNVNWMHRFNHHIYTTLGFNFSRLRTLVTPYFDNRKDISGDAGITGNSRAPSDYGPPSLVFSSGIDGLSDVQSAFNRNRNDSLSASASWYHDKHNFTFGTDFRRQEFNYLAQLNSRGTFTFTGTATQGPGGAGGDPFADFLTGYPDGSSIAFGNADKYFRQSVYDAYATDDWRIRPELTINAGLRWEYGAPITELFNRLVNLDVAFGFTAVAPVLASDPIGSKSGYAYPASLIRADHLGIEPRVGISWRPIPGSTLVIRAGYGVYDDTSVYQATALQMAQQAPLSTSFNASSSTCAITLAKGFNCASVPTFGVDPNFRVGYAQTWQLSAQRDLPGALQMTVTYFGIKGTRGVQEYLPNTYPIGASSTCSSPCSSGFTYRSSNGNSRRESGSVQLRRRLRSGFTASAQYTFSKSIDDDSVLGGQGPIAPGATSQNLATPSIAQDWRNLSAERSLSNFDQRHLLNAQIQYTSGMGLGGGTLMTGWRGRLLKDWTAQGLIVAGTGLPETPIYLALTPGSGVSGALRPNRTTASIYAAPAGKFLNAAAYATPSRQWGNAGRNSITGPGQFSFNASLARTFRLTQRLNLDFRVDSTNLLNHVVYTSWVNTTNSSQFGAPAAANPMRSLQATTRLRF